MFYPLLSPPPSRNAFGQTSKEKETRVVYAINGSEASQNKTPPPNGCMLSYCRKNAVEVAAVEFKGKSWWKERGKKSLSQAMIKHPLLEFITLDNLEEPGALNDSFNRVS